VHIVINREGRVTLDSPAEFTAFDVQAADSSAGAVLAALGGDASPVPENDHVFVALDAVRRMAGEAVDDSWEVAFGEMLVFAASKGWLNEDGTAIKAHIEHT
jgi:hypothetical protein